MKKSHFGLSVILSAALAFQCAAPVFAENSAWSTNDIVNSAEHRCGGNVTDAVALVSEEEQAEIAEGIKAAWDEYESREIRASYKSTSYDYTSDYLYKQMDSESKAVYKQLDDACSKLLTEAADITFAVNVNYNNTISPYYVVHTFSFDDEDLDKMKSVTSAFYYANPQYFFVGMLAWSSNAGYLLTYDGYENGQKRIEAAKKIDTVADSWLSDINKGADVLEKESILYKKICDSVAYHYDSSGNPVSEDSNQTIAGALLNETCVCNGYAMTVTYFCHLLGIECIGVVSSNHAWNRIELNGKWYDLDTTWMDGYEETGMYWYDYCNKGENVFETQDESGSHIVQAETYTDLELPQCSDDMPLHIELTADDADDGSVKLSWEWISDAEEYGVYRYTNSNIYAIGSTLSTSYEVENPVKGDGYFVRAKIKNVNTGEYVWSAYTNGSIAYPPSALVEEKPEITAAIAGDGQVGLNWTTVDGASKYAVYTYLNGAYTCVGSRTGTGMYVTGLTNGTKYGFLVRAYVNGKWTSFTSSDIVYATPVSAAKPEITAAIAGDGQVGLNWTAVDGASKYAVYTYLNGTYTCVGSRTGTGMYVTGLTNGTKYGFLVRAYVNGKWTSFTSSDIVYATPVSAAKPEITAAIAGDGQVGLNWTAVDGASKYAVYTYLNGAYTCVGSRTGTGMYVTGLTNGTKYGFLVRAYVNGKWTSFTSSDIVYATPVSAAKPDITAAIAGDGQVGLNWTAVDGASKYAVYTYLNGTYTCVGSRTGTGMYVTRLTNGTKYGFLVRAYVNGKWTSFTSSDIVYATPKAAVNTSALIDELIAAMNEIRTQNSLSSLSKSDELCQQAAAKLEEMSGWGGTNTSIILQGCYQIVGSGDVDGLIARIIENDTSNKNMLNAEYTKAGAAYDYEIDGWVIYFE